MRIIWSNGIWRVDLWSSIQPQNTKISSVISVFWINICNYIGIVCSDASHSMDVQLMHFHTWKLEIRKIHVQTQWNILDGLDLGSGSKASFHKVQIPFFKSLWKIQVLKQNTPQQFPIHPKENPTFLHEQISFTRWHLKLRMSISGFRIQRINFGRLHWMEKQFPFQ